MRAVRSDKKVSIEARLLPSVDAHVCEIVYVCQIPRKDVGEYLVRAVLYDRDLIDNLRHKFRFNFEFDDEFVLFGNPERSKYKKPRSANRELYTRIPQELHDRLELFAHAMGGASIAATTGFLVTKAFETQRIVAELLRRHPPTDVHRRERARTLWNRLFPRAAY